MIELTWKQIKNFGLEKKVIEWKGWDYYRVMERGIPDGELIEFDDEFEKQEDKNRFDAGDSITFVVRFNYKQELTKEQKSEVERRFNHFVHEIWNSGTIDPYSVESSNYEISGIVDDEEK